MESSTSDPQESQPSIPERVSDPRADAKALERLVRGNRTFGFELHQKLRSDKAESNLVYSPHNLSSVLSMLYAGAEAKTAEQMKSTLHFELPSKQLHPAFNKLEQSLRAAVERDSSRQDSDQTDSDSSDDSTSSGDALRTAQAIWAQKNYSIRDSYLRVLGRHYGSRAYETDFQNSPADAVDRINRWVQQQTQGEIDELVSRDAIGDRTRLILTAAIYLKAQWAHTFNEKRTKPADFRTLAGTTNEVEMMHQKLRRGYGYAEGEQYRAVELPYRGNQLSMVVVLPDKGAFEQVESKLGHEFVEGLFETLAPKPVDLKMPTFEFASRFSARKMLQSLGMPRAFSDQAEFGGISDSKPPLMVSDVIHKARITVDETGTEAAAASGVTMKATSMPMEKPEYQTVTVDRPFMFMIRHRETDTVLFAGRVVTLGAS